MKLEKTYGFTFIEFIFVVTVFSILAVIIGSIFVLFSKSQAATKISQELLADGRYVLEVMVREARMAQINYDSYSNPIINPQEALNLINPDNENITFQSVSTGCSKQVSSCIEVTKSGKSAIISGDRANIRRLNFFINPEEDPFASAQGIFASNEQPIVTIVLELQSTEDPTKVIRLQSSASSKRYLR